MTKSVSKNVRSLRSYVMRLIFLNFFAALMLTACSNGEDPRDSNWELLGNSHEMQHHSELTQINEDSVSELGLAWSVDMPSVDGMVGNPLIKDGRVFQSGALGKIYANDVHSGELLWEFDPEINFEGLSINALWASRFNRGVALSQDVAIVATGDCRLIAVDQKTGKMRWEAQSCDPKQMYGITAAPRVGGDLVFTGNSCLDSGMSRGFVDAFDVGTGERRWRFYTVPGDPADPPEDEAQAMAAKTWGTDWYAKTKGCGSVWDAMTYDPELDLLYLGVAGPGPYTPAGRAPDAGDELFTNSIVAVDAKTGKYVWHFKQVPNDGWNYDASMGIMVATLPIAGKQKRVVISVPKNGFFYVLDAKSGQFISGKNYVPVNWAKGLDKDGRPIPDPDARYWEKPDGTAIVVPSPIGAHNWEAIAYDPKQQLVYIPALVMPTKVSTNKDALVGGLSMDFFYGSKGDPKWPTYSEIVAWDPITQTARWRQRHPMPVNGGLLNTGNLVFQGTADGFLNAFESTTGKKLWSKNVGGAIRGAPSTVMVDGEQLIIVPTGNGNSSATGTILAQYSSTPQMRTQPRLLAFKLGGNSPIPAAAEVPSMPKPPVPRFDQPLARLGQLRFEQHICSECHGLSAETVQGGVPDLRLAPPPNLDVLKAIVIGGALKANGMPQYEHLTPEEAESIYAFVINQAWDAYDAEHKGTSENDTDPDQE